MTIANLVRAAFSITVISCATGKGMERPVPRINASSQALLEPIVSAWSTGAGANYHTHAETRAAVYRLADKDNNGYVTVPEAKAMAERCPADNDYTCR